MKKLTGILVAIIICSSLQYCKSKEKDPTIKEAVEVALAANSDFSGLRADVKDGVATITGEVKDESTKMAVTPAVSAVKGVKSVQNNTTVAAPAPVSAPVVISADDPLTKGVADALKDHPTVKATVSNGVITVTGEATSANRVKIKQALDALHPKKTDLSGLKTIR